MNFSSLQRLPLLDDPRLRRWAPALLVALIAQAALLKALPQAESDPRRARRSALADDTPTLLRWSRTARAATASPSLPTTPLQGLAALPPPPLSSLPNGAAPEHLPAAPVRPQPPAPEPPAQGLPRQPGEAFRLARQVAQGEPPAQPSLALVAVQRRQWWLLPGQDHTLQTLWDSGQDQALPPALGSVPEGVASRAVAAAAAAPLALGEVHGRSLRAGNQLWVLWRQGATLWLLRGPLASGAS